MRKLIYLPVMRKLTDTVLGKFKSYGAVNGLHFEICIPVIYPSLLLSANECPTFYYRDSVDKWQKLFSQRDVEGVKVSFQLVYAYNSFLSDLLFDDTIQFIHCDHKFLFSRWFGRHKDKHIDVNLLG